MATIKEVAAASGVSIATVSYILNDREINVRPETRERVLRAVRELNYRPNALFRGQNDKVKKTVGVIYPDFGSGRLMDQPYYAYLLDGILFALAQQRWSTSLFAEENWSGAISSLRTFCDGRCDGLVLMGPDETSNIVAALRERGFPFVLINTGTLNPEIASVDVDNVDAARRVAEYLIQRGHKRIAMVPGNPQHDSTEQRLQGFLQGLESARLTCPPEWLIAGEYADEFGYARTPKLFTGPRSEWPTALFCGNDAIARGAYRALREMGLSIPGDISIIGFDDQAFAETLDPPLTTMRQPLRELGERAVELLLSQIDAGALQHREVQKVIVPSELIERSSVGPPSE